MRFEKLSKVSRSNRRLLQTIHLPATYVARHDEMIEHLENRVLLSATLVSQIPAKTLNAGGAGTSITLGTYLKDPSLTGGTVVEMQTPLGNIPLQLTDSKTPKTVANFVSYINNGEYTPTIIQRSVPGFVLQGGGTKPDGSNNTPDATLVSEAGISNTTGTIAIALSTGPNSGNNQWFINLGNNSSELDGTVDGGPFTVFGNVIDNGMTIANSIANLDIIDGSSENGNWSTLPVINYTGASSVTSVPQANLVTDNVVQIPASQTISYTAVSANPAMVTANVSGGVLTIASPAGAPAGSTTVTATVTDLSGETASSTFTVSVAPTVSVTNAAATLGAGSQVVFPVTLSAAVSSATTFSYAVAAGTAPAADFQATGSTVTIPAGGTAASIPVTIVGDTTGAAETFTLTLSGLSTNAVFAGAGTTLTATGTIYPAVIPAGQTTTTLTASTLSAAFGQADTFTATVTPSTAEDTVTGSVSFLDNGAVVGTETVTGNVATLALNLNTAGVQSITAAYSGDSTDTASTSSTITVNVAASSAVAPALAATKVPVTAIAGQPYKGAITFSLNNSNLVVAQQGEVMVNVYLTADGQVTPTSPVLASLAKAVNIKPGKTALLSVPVKSLPDGLAAGTYTITAQAVDTTGVATAVVTGPSISVAPAMIALTESFARLVLPTAVVAGAKTSAAALLRISNSGNIASAGTTTISLYASPDGTTAAGILFRTLTPKLNIKPGKAAVVSIPLSNYPASASGNYYIVAQVIDSQSNVSSVTSAATVTIAAAFVTLGASGLKVPAAAVSSVAVSLTIANTGNVVAAGAVSITFATSASADGSSPTTLVTVPVSVKIQPGKTQLLRPKVRIAAGSLTGSLYLVAELDFSAVPELSGESGSTLVSVLPIEFK